MSIITIGIAFAKNVFAVHGVDETGKAVLVKPKVPRDQLLSYERQTTVCSTVVLYLLASNWLE